MASIFDDPGLEFDPVATEGRGGSVFDDPGLEFDPVEDTGGSSAPSYGLRSDGTRKGRGWLGEIKLPDGGVATEYTMQSDAVSRDGKHIDFPTLVPTLTDDEVELMRSDIIPNKKGIPDAIAQKAVDHALMRISAGKSVFSDNDLANGRSDSTPAPNPFIRKMPFDPMDKGRVKKIAKDFNADAKNKETYRPFTRNDVFDDKARAKRLKKIGVTEEDAEKFYASKADTFKRMGGTPDDQFRVDVFNDMAGHLKQDQIDRRVNAAGAYDAEGNKADTEGFWASVRDSRQAAVGRRYESGFVGTIKALAGTLFSHMWKGDVEADFERSLLSDLASGGEMAVKKIVGQSEVGTFLYDYQKVDPMLASDEELESFADMNGLGEEFKKTRDLPTAERVAALRQLAGQKLNNIQAIRNEALERMELRGHSKMGKLGRYGVETVGYTVPFMLKGPFISLATMGDAVGRASRLGTATFDEAGKVVAAADESGLAAAKGAGGAAAATGSELVVGEVIDLALSKFPPLKWIKGGAAKMLSRSASGRAVLRAGRKLASVAEVAHVQSFPAEEGEEIFEGLAGATFNLDTKESETTTKVGDRIVKVFQEIPETSEQLFWGMTGLSLVGLPVSAKAQSARWRHGERSRGFLRGLGMGAEDVEIMSGEDASRLAGPGLTGELVKRAGSGGLSADQEIFLLVLAGVDEKVAKAMSAEHRREMAASIAESDEMKAVAREFDKLDGRLQVEARRLNDEQVWGATAESNKKAFGGDLKAGLAGGKTVVDGDVAVKIGESGSGEQVIEVTDRVTGYTDTVPLMFDDAEGRAIALDSLVAAKKLADSKVRYRAARAETDGKREGIVRDIAGRVFTGGENVVMVKSAADAQRFMATDPGRYGAVPVPEDSKGAALADGTVVVIENNIASTRDLVETMLHERLHAALVKSGVKGGEYADRLAEISGLDPAYLKQQADRITKQYAKQGVPLTEFQALEEALAYESQTGKELFRSTLWQSLYAGLRGDKAGVAKARQDVYKLVGGMGGQGVKFDTWAAAEQGKAPPQGKKRDLKEGEIDFSKPSIRSEDMAAPADGGAAPAQQQGTPVVDAEGFLVIETESGTTRIKVRGKSPAEVQKIWDDIRAKDAKRGKGAAQQARPVFSHGAVTPEQAERLAAQGLSPDEIIALTPEEAAALIEEFEQDGRRAAPEPAEQPPAGKPAAEQPAAEPGKAPPAPAPGKQEDATPAPTPGPAAPEQKPPAPEQKPAAEPEKPFEPPAPKPEAKQPPKPEQKPPEPAALPSEPGKKPEQKESDRPKGTKAVDPKTAKMLDDLNKQDRDIEEEISTLLESWREEDEQSPASSMDEAATRQQKREGQIEKLRDQQHHVRRRIDAIKAGGKADTPAAPKKTQTKPPEPPAPKQPEKPAEKPPTPEPAVEPVRQPGEKPMDFKKRYDAWEEAESAGAAKTAQPRPRQAGASPRKAVAGPQHPGEEPVQRENEPFFDFGLRVAKWRKAYAAWQAAQQSAPAPEQARQEKPAASEAKPDAQKEDPDLDFAEHFSRGEDGSIRIKVQEGHVLKGNLYRFVKSLVHFGFKDKAAQKMMEHLLEYSGDVLRKGVVAISGGGGTRSYTSLLFTDTDSGETVKTLLNGVRLEHIDELTIVHELVHVATMTAVRVPKVLSDEGRAALARVTDFFNKHADLIQERVEDVVSDATQEQINSWGLPGRGEAIGRVDELIAYTLSSPKFRRIIDGILYENKRSLLDEVLDFIVSLFGGASSFKTIDTKALTKDALLVFLEGSANVEYQRNLVLGEYSTAAEQAASRRAAEGFVASAAAKPAAEDFKLNDGTAAEKPMPPKTDREKKEEEATNLAQQHGRLVLPNNSGSDNITTPEKAEGIIPEELPPLNKDASRKAQEEDAEAREILKAVWSSTRRRLSAGLQGPTSGWLADIVKHHMAQKARGARTPDSVARQAYSTPMPLAAWMGEVLRRMGLSLPNASAETLAVEPTAGNGALLAVHAGVDGARLIANEIDPARVENMRRLFGERGGANRFTAYDILKDAKKFYDSVKEAAGKNVKSALVFLANPPFGKAPDGKPKGRYASHIELGIVEEGLQAMMDARGDNPDAPPVTGAFAIASPQGLKANRGFLDMEKADGIANHYRTGEYKRFFQWLGENFFIEKFTMHGDMYKKGGASFPVDVIFVRQRVTAKDRENVNWLWQDNPQVVQDYGQLVKTLYPNTAPTRAELASGLKSDGEFVLPEATPAGDAAKPMAFKHGERVVVKVGGVTYSGEFDGMNPDGSARIRAFKMREGKQGFRGFGVDKDGKVITRDVGAPLADVVSTDAKADVSKLSDADKRRMAIGGAATGVDAEADDHRAEIRADERRAAEEGSGDVVFRLADDTTPEVQYEAVRAAHHNADGTPKATWLKAPNGKPTKLTERQWVQVRTPAFKAWFGDWEDDPANASKVVDENGEPLVVYHGTNKIFSVFDVARSFGGLDASFFARSRKVSEQFGTPGTARTMSVFLRAVNLFDATNNEHIETLKSYFQKNVPQGFYSVFFGKNIQVSDVIRRIEGSKGDYYTLEDRDIFTAIREAGFDGVNVTGDKGENIAVFFSSQIKSATDNTGAYSKASDDIHLRLNIEVERGERPPDTGMSIYDLPADNLERAMEWLRFAVKSGVFSGDHQLATDAVEMYHEDDQESRDTGETLIQIHDLIGKSMQAEKRPWVSYTVGDGVRALYQRLFRERWEKGHPKPPPKNGPSKIQVPYDTGGEPESALGAMVSKILDRPSRDALAELKKDVGDVVDYVAKELGRDRARTLGVLDSSQAISVAMMIRNFKQGRGFILGDQAGFGKGRPLAAYAWWHIRNGRLPVFVTGGINAFDELSGAFREIRVWDEVRPFVTNKDFDTFDASGATGSPRNAVGAGSRLRHIQSGRVPERANMIVTTYSQFQQDDASARARKDFIKNALHGNGVLILDESHMAAGAESNRGAFFRELVEIGSDRGRPAVFSSATFSKRPDTMAIYMRGTGIGELFGGDADLLEGAFRSFGVPFQEWVSSFLAAKGEYLRRESSFEGVKFNETLTTHGLGADAAVDVEEREREAGDSFGAFVRQMLAVQGLMKNIKGLTGAAHGENAPRIQFTSWSGVVHNFLDYITTAVKARRAADLAVEALRRGESPVVTLHNTMESRLEEVGIGNVATPRVMLNGMARKTVNIDFDGHPVNLTALSPASRALMLRYMSEGQIDMLVREAQRLTTLAEHTAGTLESLDIPTSPIDYVAGRIKKAGFDVVEITGRGLEVGPDGRVRKHTVEDGRAAINKFNNKPGVAAIINVKAAASISMHASPKFNNQQKRVMIVLQTMPDINNTIQVLGRINRSGQLVDPEYYMLTSTLLSERRQSSVMVKKLRSLSANSSGEADGNYSVDGYTDIFNEYGESALAEILADSHKYPDAATVNNSVLSNTKGLGVFTKYLSFFPFVVQETVWNNLNNLTGARMEIASALGENTTQSIPVGASEGIRYMSPAERGFGVGKVKMVSGARKMTHADSVAEAERGKAAWSGTELTKLRGEMTDERAKRIAAVKSEDAKGRLAENIGRQEREINGAIDSIGQIKVDPVDSHLVMVVGVTRTGEGGYAATPSNYTVTVSHNNRLGVAKMSLPAFNALYMALDVRTTTQGARFDREASYEEERDIVYGDISRFLHGLYNRSAGAFTMRPGFARYVPDGSDTPYIGALIPRGVQMSREEIERREKLARVDRTAENLDALPDDPNLASSANRAASTDGTAAIAKTTSGKYVLSVKSGKSLGRATYKPRVAAIEAANTANGSRRDVESRGGWYTVRGASRPVADAFFKAVTDAGMKFDVSDALAERRADAMSGDVMFRLPANDAEAEAASNKVMFKLRTEPAPERTEKFYKLMRVVDGKPYALFIGRAEPFEIGRWYDADSPSVEDMDGLDAGHTYLIDADGNAEVQEFGNRKQAPSVKQVDEATRAGKRYMHVGAYADGTRKYANWGVNGGGQVAEFAFRPGLHATDAPSARQIGEPVAKGSADRWRREDEFWTEIEVAADVDWQAEADKSPSKAKGMAHIPRNGYYSFATNTNASKRQNWIIAGSMKIIRVLPDAEARRIAKDGGFEPDWNKRSSGREAGDVMFRLAVTPEQDAGEVIPLSRRFNTASDNVRFRLSDESGDYGQPGLYAFNPEKYRPAVVEFAKGYFGDRDAPNGRKVWQNFVRWFGDSQVVDKDGKPLIVYHGTSNTEFSVFDQSKISSEKPSDYGKGFYFTPFEFAADFYRKESLKENDVESQRLWDLIEKSGIENADPKLVERFVAARKQAAERGGGRLVAVFLNIKNPLLVTEGDAYDATKTAIEKGKDGVIVGDVREPSEVIALLASQIKSATDNTGDYSRASNDVMFRLSDDEFERYPVLGFVAERMQILTPGVAIRRAAVKGHSTAEYDAVEGTKFTPEEYRTFFSPRGSMPDQIATAMMNETGLGDGDVNEFWNRFMAELELRRGARARQREKLKSRKAAVREVMQATGASRAEAEALVDAAAGWLMEQIEAQDGAGFNTDDPFDVVNMADVVRVAQDYRAAGEAADAVAEAQARAGSNIPRGDGGAFRFRKVDMNAARDAMDMPEVRPGARYTDSQALADAAAATKNFTEVEIEGKRIVAEILAKPRAPTKLEKAILDAYEVWLWNAFNKQDRDARQYAEWGDVNSLDMVDLEREQWRRDVDDLTRASLLSGTEAGRSLQAFKMALDSEYNLVRIMREARKRNDGPLSQKQMDNLMRIVKRLKDAVEAFREATGGTAERELEDAEAEIMRLAGQGERLAADLAAAKQRVAEAEGRIGELGEERERLEKEIADAEAAFAALEKELAGDTAKLAAKRAEAEAALAAAQARVGEVHAEMDAMRAEIAALNDLLRKAEARSRAAEDRLRKATAKAKELRDKVQKMTAFPERVFSPEKQAELQKLMEEMRQAQDEKNRALEALQWRKANAALKLWYAIRFWQNFRRASETSGDMSVSGRQNAKLLLSNPILWLTSFVETFGLVAPFVGGGVPAKGTLRAKSDLRLFLLESRLRADPVFEEARRAGLDWISTDGSEGNMDEFSGNVTSTLRGMGRAGRIMAAFVSISQNHYAGFANHLHLAVYKQQRALAMWANGRELTKEEKEQIAVGVNVLGGRGDLRNPKTRRLAAAGVDFLYSPRLMLSNVQTFTRLGTIALAHNSEVSWKTKAVQYSQYARIATGYVIATLLKRLLDEMVGDGDDDDEKMTGWGAWTHAQFGKLIVGDTPLDVLGGLPMYVRTVARLGGSSSSKRDVKSSVVTGDYKHQQMDVMGRFITNKMSPFFRSMSDSIMGRDFDRRAYGLNAEPDDPGYNERVGNFLASQIDLTPLGFRDIYSAATGGRKPVRDLLTFANILEDAPDLDEPPAELLGLLGIAVASTIGILGTRTGIDRTAMLSDKQGVGEDYVKQRDSFKKMIDEARKMDVPADERAGAVERLEAARDLFEERWRERYGR